ncbi:MAG: hypothetical protein GF350_06515 [Chitinivibrionales bacterium]|nr:hypothetical protein [Chitinivibrionales bacterium]
MRIKIIVYLMLMIAAVLHAQTPMKGVLTAKVIESSGNPYIIEEDVIIPADKEVTIKEGCIFLFKPFTGMQVKGKLVVEGTSNAPVVFTSINDQEYNPNSQELANPFDWNGILVGRESRGAFMKNFRLRFSVYGIKGQTPSIMIQNGKLRQNGQFHFTINDKIQAVQDGIPFSYGIDRDDEFGDQGGDPGPDKKKKRKGPRGKDPKQKRIFRFASLGIGIAGIGVSAVYGALAAQSHQKLWEISDAPIGKYDDSDFDATQKLRNRRILGSALSGTIGLLGITGFTLTFVF